MHCEMNTSAVAVVKLHETEVYVVLGIDENEHDQVLALFYTYYDAKQFCSQTMHDTCYYDLWIEKHPVL